MRLATTDDAIYICDLEYELFPGNNLSAKTICNELELGYCIVEHDEGDLVGYIMVREDGDLSDILRVGVAEEYRGEGIAAKMLQKVISRAGKLMLTVRKDNDKALSIYKNFGFAITAHLPDTESWMMERPTSVS